MVRVVSIYLLCAVCGLFWIQIQIFKSVTLSSHLWLGSTTISPRNHSWLVNAHVHLVKCHGSNDSRVLAVHWASSLRTLWPLIESNSRRSDEREFCCVWSNRLIISGWWRERVVSCCKFISAHAFQFSSLVKLIGFGLKSHGLCGNQRRIDNKRVDRGLLTRS